MSPHPIIFSFFHMNKPVMAQWQTIIITIMVFPSAKTSVTNISSTCGDPFNITVPLSCDGVGTWLHIIQETYGSADPRTGYCAFAPGCPQASLSSSQTMLKCSCNGPSPQNKNVCKEEVIATKEMLNACGQVTNSAIVGVQYRCIPATEIIDMCGRDIHWTSDGHQAAAFLATPQFSNPPVLNAHCTCNITGEALKLQILELQADIDLVMEDPLNITASDGDVWSAATLCKKCHVEKFNEVVYHSAKNYSELTVNFQDNRRAGQRVWLEIQGGSQTLAISCHATTATPTELTMSTLPATITTAPMRTTSSTDATTKMLMTKTTYSTVTAAPTIGVLPHIISTKSAPTLKDPDVLTSTTAVLTHRQTENSSSKEVNNNGQNVALVMGLFFVAVILVAVAITLAVLLWRRYQQIQKDGAEVYITHNSWNIFSLVFWYQHCHDTRKTSMSSTQQTLHFADLTKSIWLQEQNSEEVPRGNRLNHNDTMSDSPLFGSHTEVLCESHNHNICLGQSENTPRGNVESNNSQTEAGSLGNSSATNPMQAHSASGYAVSNCTFQTDMEDAVEDFHRHAPDLKQTFCSTGDDFVNTSDGSSSLLKQDRDDAGLEKLTGIHNAFLQEENQSGKEFYALEQENKEQAYFAKPLQHQGIKEKKSTSQTPLHREEGPSSEKLTQNKNIGGRKLGLHASNIHNSHDSGCEKLQGSPTGTLVKKEMSCEERARESKSKRSKGQKTEDGKKIGDVTNKECTENNHDSESRKNKTGEIVSRVLGQTLEGIINQRRGLFLEQNGLPGLNSDLQQQQETSENKSTSHPNSDCDVDSHSEHAAKQAQKRQRQRPKAHYHLFLDETESNNSSNV